MTLFANSPSFKMNGSRGPNWKKWENSAHSVDLSRSPKPWRSQHGCGSICDQGQAGCHTQKDAALPGVATRGRTCLSDTGLEAQTSFHTSHGDLSQGSLAWNLPSGGSHHCCGCPCTLSRNLNLLGTLSPAPFVVFSLLAQRAAPGFFVLSGPTGSHQAKETRLCDKGMLCLLPEMPSDPT